MMNREDGFKENYTVSEGKLTVYRLNAGVVESVAFIDPVKVLRRLSQFNCVFQVQSIN